MISSGRLLLASLLLVLAMGCVGLGLRAAAPAFAAKDRPGATDALPASSYVPLVLALVLMVGGVVVLISALRHRK